MSSIFELSLERNLKSGEKEVITLISLPTTPARELDDKVSFKYDETTEISADFVKNMIINAYQEELKEQQNGLQRLEDRMALILKSNLSADMVIDEINEYYSSKEFYKEEIEQCKTMIDRFGFALSIFEENTTYKYHDDGEENFKLTYYFA